MTEIPKAYYACASGDCGAHEEMCFSASRMWWWDGVTLISKSDDPDIPDAQRLAPEPKDAGWYCDDCLFDFDAFSSCGLTTLLKHRER